MGYVYVSDNYNHRIQKFTFEGKFMGWIGKCTAGPNCDLNYDGAKDFGCNANTCTGLGPGHIVSQFHFSLGIAVDSSGNIYVADSVNNRIQKFSSNGSFIATWGSQCNLSNGTGCIDPDGPTGPLSLGDGQFSSIGDVAIDSLDRVYVSDSGNNRIEVFAPK